MLSLLPLGFLFAGAVPVVEKATVSEKAVVVENPKVHIWICFTDKGESSVRDIEYMLDTASADLLPRARARRLKNMGPRVVDYLDVPVSEVYVDHLQQLGVKLRHRSKWLNAISVEVDLALIREIRALPYVTKIAPVRKLIRPEVFEQENQVFERSAGEPVPDLSAGRGDPDFYGPSYPYLNEIGVVAVHDSGYSGAGVLVGMLDTGFYKEHEAFDSLTVASEWDFIFGDGETQNEPEDDEAQDEHGTITWSIIGGFSPGSLIGPAYGASYVLAKTEDITSETPLEEDNYVAALEWMDSLGVDLTSSSLSYRWFDDPGDDYGWEDLDGNTATTTIAVDIAASRGILCVTSAGNYGPDPGSLGTPADADSVISVGGIDEEGVVLWFSSRGPTFDGRTKPEVLARGVDVYCAFHSSPSSYTYAAGTSVSCPLVAGSAALVMEAHPDWSAMQVRAALMWTAHRAANPDNEWGWGLIDVHSAIYNVTSPRHIVPTGSLLPGTSPEGLYR